jgi:hypothetical protein
VEVLKDGSLLVSDEQNGAIWRVTYNSGLSVNLQIALWVMGAVFVIFFVSAGVVLARRSRRELEFHGL